MFASGLNKRHTVIRVQKLLPPKETPNMLRYVAALSLLCASCAVGSGPLDGPDPVEVDAAAVVPHVDAAPIPSAPDAATVDAGTAEAAAPEASQATIDAGTDRREASTATTPETGPSVMVDAGRDAAAGTGIPSIDRSIALVVATFPQPCAPENARQCGGVVDGATATLPLVCRSGHWTLAGALTGPGNWVSFYSCSHGCQAGQLCMP